MAQKHLPIFPQELTPINEQVEFQKKGNRVYYFHRGAPIFFHDETDICSFRFITSQLIANGSVKQIEISKAFSTTYIDVKRNVKRLRKHGPKEFFKKPKGGTSHILTPEVLEEAQWLLYEGYDLSEVAKKLNLKANTVCKAILAGRLYKKKRTKDLKFQTKSERNVLDKQAEMGIGCTRKLERIQAAFGELNGVSSVTSSQHHIKIR